MMYLDWTASGASDPFWNSVLLLAPCSDSGTSFTDYGPLANTISVVGSVSTGGTFEQNSAHPLWGENTLEVSNTGVGSSANLYVNNTSVSLAANSDYCIEWSFNQQTIPSASWPPHVWFQFGPAGSPLIAGTSNPVNALSFRSLGGGSLTSSSLAQNTWHHVALQYLDSAGRFYIYVNGTNIGSIAEAIGFSTAFRVFVMGLNTTAGADSFVFSVRIANIRITAANRYGNVSSIATPTGPFPIG